MFQGLLGFAKPALLVACGGAVGALLRAGAYLLAQRGGAPLPWATLTVNVLGSLAIGLFFGAGLEKGPAGEELRLLVTVGLLGALTTFSTFSGEALQMAQAGRWAVAAAHVLGNNLGCFAAVWAGWKLSGGV